MSNPAREIPRIPLGWNNCQLRYETITSPHGCLAGPLGSDDAVTLNRDRERDFLLAHPRSLAQEDDTALSVLRERRISNMEIMFNSQRERERENLRNIIFLNKFRSVRKKK